MDEMDSLFEGMVLFDPSQVSVPSDQQPSRIDKDDDDDDDEKHQHQTSVLPPPSPTTAATPSVSQPLDENLFSDLTLITQTLEQPLSDPSPTTTISRTTSTGVTKTPISRQVSTIRKKKRAGLRIGYKNDDLDSELPLHQSSSIPSESEFRLGTAADSAQQPQQEADTTTTEAVVNKPDKIQGEKPSADIVQGKEPSADIIKGEEPSADIIQEEEPSADIIGGEDPAVEQVNSSTIEQRFEQIKTLISENLNHARELVASVAATRKDSIRKRRKAAENLSLASTKYRELERELEEACETEDFLTAHRLSENLASADTEKETLAVALRDADAECDAVDSKMQEVLDLQIAAEEECVSLLQSFSTDAANDADLVLKNAEVMSSKETSKWLSSVEAMEVKRMELDIESHLVNEAQLVLNDSIGHIVEDDRRERELLCKKKELLREELDKLLALVRQKEAEIAENESSIEKVEKRISDAVSSFQEVKSSISTKSDNLQSGLSEMKLQNEALSKQKKEIDDFLSQEEGRGEKLQELSRTSANEANMYHEVARLRKGLVQFILRSREYKVRLTKTGDKLSEDVQMLKQEITKARASLQELSSTKTSLQQETESFKQRVLFIDKRVPELEAEKKVAATVRNFKEAARIAAEAKTLSVEKEVLQSRVEGSLSNLEKLEEEISGTVNRLQEIDVQLSSKEKELAMTRCHILLLIAGAATAERSAALELGDLEEADILLGEAEVAESEARKLQSIYNFKDEEFENLPKQFISMELVSKLCGKKLVELAASANISAS